MDQKCIFNRNLIQNNYQHLIQVQYILDVQYHVSIQKSLIKFLKSIKISHKFTSNDFSQYYHKLQRQILKITKQNRPTAIIFGIPQRMIQRQYYVYAQIGMRSLIEGFLQRYELKQNEEKNDQQIFHYTLIDERWSTRQASQKLKDIQLIYAKWGHLHKQKQLLDGMAAMKILERYLDYYNKQ